MEDDSDVNEIIPVTVLPEAAVSCFFVASNTDCLNSACLTVFHNTADVTSLIKNVTINSFDAKSSGVGATGDQSSNAYNDPSSSSTRSRS